MTNTNKTPALVGAGIGLATFLAVALLPALLYGGYAGVLLAGGIFGTPVAATFAVRALIVFGMVLGVTAFEHELADADFCMALKRSGCVMLKLGLESGDQGVLDRLHKGIDLGQASRILTNLRRAGIAAYIYLLFGTPAETLTEARRTLEFVVRHREAIGFMNLALFNMPVYGDEAAEYETEPFYEGDLSLYTAFRHPRGWDRKEVRQFLANEFKRDPAVAAILKNDPPLFSSNHAAFFQAYR